uniref:Solute carrier family 2, facilitated glucose transporter member 5 n=1 Tax=Electrophorus electricus TaxID=8005 RepID=A0AAY5ETM1_ELEEL
MYLFILLLQVSFCLSGCDTCAEDHSMYKSHLFICLLTASVHLYVFFLLLSPSQYIKEFFNLTTVERYGTSMSTEGLTVLYSVTVSIFALGGLVGSFTVRMLVTKFGRYTLVFAGSAFPFFSAGVGIALSVVPMYLGEIAPKNLRGFLGLVPSIFICIGVFFAQILGLQEILGEEQHWPLFLSLTAVPAFIQLMLLPWFPESPRYLLIEKHNIHATVAALKTYRGKANNQEEVEEMQEEQHFHSSVQTVSVCELLRDRTVRWQVLSVAVVNMGMQLSGIDAVSVWYRCGCVCDFLLYFYYNSKDCSVLFSSPQCFTIERIGRKPLLIGGFGFMGICCSGITFSLILQARVPFMHYISVACVVGIIAGFCIGPAGVPFLVTGELFTQSHRPAAYIVGGALNWLSNFTVGFLFPFLQMSAGAFCYLVFFGVCIGVAVYVYFIIPETKNKTFMEISQMFASTSEQEVGALGVGAGFSLKQAEVLPKVSIEIKNNDKKCLAIWENYYFRNVLFVIQLL